MTPRRIAIGIATALLVAGSTAWAGKPGGGGGGPVDSGKIYYAPYGALGISNPYTVFAMNPDGTGKTALFTREANFVDASRSLHGGSRWILAKTHIDGETTPSGGPRGEMVAFREDGTFVRLTYSAGYVGVSGVAGRWGPGDAQVAWYQHDSSDTSHDGIYVADVAYDAGGAVSGLVSIPTIPAVPDSVLGFAYGNQEFDWSPDGTRMVLFDRNGSGGSTIRIVVLSTGASTVLSTASNAAGPRWSPDGASIVYGQGGNGVRVIAANGTNDHQVFGATTTTAYASPLWSPNGTNIAFGYFAIPRSPNASTTVDVARSLPTGGTITNLTTDFSDNSAPFAWR